MDSKNTLVAGMFYTFVILTSVAFLLHLFGLEWFESTITIPEPAPMTQNVILASLKAFELAFIYKLLTKKGWMLCIAIACIQSVVTGFFAIRTLLDALCMFLIPLLFRRSWSAVVDFVFVYLFMTIYGAMVTFAKFGDIDTSYVTNFYANIIAVMDYKLFIVSLYLYAEYKGGIKLWLNRKILS